ncbi:hypothetical protein Tco_0266298 [Tanacetum coccineum]
MWVAHVGVQTKDKYCQELLKEYGLLGCKPVSTPIEPNFVLPYVPTKDDPLLENITGYQKLLGKLIYLTHTMPDIAIYALSFKVSSEFKKTYTISKSSTEAEYRSLSSVACLLIALIPSYMMRLDSLRLEPKLASGSAMCVHKTDAVTLESRIISTNLADMVVYMHMTTNESMVGNSISTSVVLDEFFRDGGCGDTRFDACNGGLVDLLIRWLRITRHAVIMEAN